MAKRRRKKNMGAVYKQGAAIGAAFGAIVVGLYEGLRAPEAMKVFVLDSSKLSTTAEGYALETSSPIARAVVGALKGAAGGGLVGLALATAEFAPDVLPWD